MERPVAPSVKELKEGMVGMLRNTSWYPYLRLFLNSSKFEEIVAGMLKDYELGYRLSPPLRYVFRPFIECPFEKTKVVFHTVSPSPYLRRADGLAFSQGITGTSDLTLKHMFKEIGATVDKHYEGSYDLTRWAQQGILLTNACSTMLVDMKEPVHLELWRTFWNYVFEVFRHDLPQDTIYVFVGDKVHDRADGLKIVCKLPEVLHRYPENWGANIFSEVNRLLKSQGKEEIKW